MNRQQLMGACYDLFYEKLTPDERGVVALAKKYNHYADDVFACIVMPKLVPLVNADDKPMGCHTKLLTLEEDNVSGFCIMYYRQDEVHLKHVFLEPIYRQHGWFSIFINGFRDQFKNIKKISLATSSEGMVRACHKNNFKLIRKCDNGKDLLFEWKRE